MEHTSFTIALSVAAAATIAGSAPAAAQDTHPDRWLIPHVGAAAALDARNGESRWSDMYLGSATLEWETPVPSLGIRLEGLYARRGQLNLLYSQGCGATCGGDPEINTSAAYSSKMTAGAGFVGVTYQTLRRGAFRQYVVGGVGAVRTHTVSASGTVARWLCTDVCILPAGPASGYSVRNERPLSTAGNIGAGAVYAWRWVSVAGEARYIAVPNGTTRGLNGALPVSLGIRLF
jgi:hypothetical protein